MIPKYEQIKQDLISEIKEHNFFPGDKFYSEADIKKHYNVSSITAVKALNELTFSGYLYRVQGKGTFVSKAKISQSVKFSDIENHPINAEKTKVISIKKECEPHILKELGLPSNSEYYKIVRVRYANNTPFLLHLSHLPKRLVKEPLYDDLSYYKSVYERVNKDFGIDLFSLSSVETNEIDFPENASILNLLKLSFREPTVKQIKHSYFPDKSIAEYIISYKHWKYFKTKIEIEA
ncbi:GntR family transcriptional regulator [Tetragenococcus halophilus]|uniref:GntR family transcriptional regulator n=1 Tax=Tetragenococcus halophilus TaxID=51669 RepID=UPI0015BBBB53|nr:GntR family transcriptional regulator [Tetragenococcus halophilus]NWO00505.1 GntR family transcriptional regulator [Tetragenococcus halophilus]